MRSPRVGYRESLFLYARRRRLRQRNNGGTHTREDLQAILKAQNNCCAYCGASFTEVKRQIDHIKPLCQGGTNDKANIQFLCPRCNKAKGALYTPKKTDAPARP